MLLVLLMLHFVMKFPGQSAGQSRLSLNMSDRKELSAAQLSKLPLESQIEELSTRYGFPSSMLHYCHSVLLFSNSSHSWLSS